MKKFAAVLALSMLIFTSCTKPEIKQEMSVTESVPAETVSEETTTAAETEETFSDTEATSVSETTEEIKPKRPEPIIHPNARGIDILGFYDKEKFEVRMKYEFADKRLCVFYELYDLDMVFLGVEMRVFDISDGEQKAHIILPEVCTNTFSTYFENIDEENVLCKIYSHDNDYTAGSVMYEWGEVNAVITVYDDYSVMVDENPDISSLPDLDIISVGNHRIKSSHGNICDADSGRILLNGISEDYDIKGSKDYRFCFTIDENRFLYNSYGYEWTWGFGVYDFTTGKATDVPNTHDSNPIGFHDGKVYSYWCEHDGFTDNTIYAADIKTLETVKLFEHDVNNIEMSEDGELLMTCGYVFDTDIFRITLSNTDNGEVLSEYDFENIGYLNVFFIDSQTIGAQLSQTLYIIDLD